MGVIRIIFFDILWHLGLCLKLLHIGLLECDNHLFGFIQVWSCRGGLIARAGNFVCRIKGVEYVWTNTILDVCKSWHPWVRIWLRACFQWQQLPRFFPFNAFSAWTHIHKLQLFHKGMIEVSEQAWMNRACGATEWPSLSWGIIWWLSWSFMLV